MHISGGQPQGGVWVVSIAFSSSIPWQDARNSSKSLLSLGIDELLYSQRHCSIPLMFELHHECIPRKMHQCSNLRKVLLGSTTLSIRHQKDHIIESHYLMRELTSHSVIMTGSGILPIRAVSRRRNVLYMTVTHHDPIPGLVSAR